MRGPHHLASLSLGVLWVVLATCQRGDSERALHNPKIIKEGYGDSALAPRFTSSPGGTVLDFEQAVRRDPQNARLLNDLGAVYLLRGYRDDQPEDFVRALDTFAKARATDPSLSEARFNLALALQRLYLNRVALASWKDYLSFDPGSSWAKEAEQQLRELGRPDASQEWEALLPKLQEAALRGDRRLVLSIVRTSPQSAREYALEEALGRWSEAQAAGDLEAISHWLRIASEVGEALRSLTGDASVSSVISTIESASTDPSRLRDLALGHQEFRDGMKAYRPLHTGDAAKHFALARGYLKQARSPLELWALCGLARCLGYKGYYDQAGQIYKEILARADRRDFSLLGWTHWGWAWVDAREGRLMSALSRTREMEEAYNQAGEAENLGAAQYLIGQALFLLGQRESGWLYDYRGLESLARLPTVFRRHVLLTSVATDAMDDHLPDASLLIQEEALRIAGEEHDPIRLTEIHAGRARLLAFLARPEEALKELRDAELAVRAAPQDDPGRKLNADLLWSEGEVWLRQDSDKALTYLSQAIKEYLALNAFSSVAYASAMRAQAYQSLGSYQEAKQDLVNAIKILEAPKNKVSSDDLKLSYINSLESAYDQMILLQWQGNNHEEALQVLERSRSPSLAHKEGVMLNRLPGDGVVVEYALLKDRLLTWVLDRHGYQSFETRISSVEVDALIDKFAEALKGGVYDQRTRSLSSRLFRLLIPEIVSGLPEKKVVYLVPDKALNKIPFAALLDQMTGRYFIEDHLVALSPGSNNFNRPRRLSEPRGSLRSALLVGNPAFDRKMFKELSALPEAETELAAAVAAGFDSSETFYAEQANKLNVLRNIDRFDIFAFAGHAVINQSNPSQSYLVLAPSKEPPDPGLLLGSDIEARKYHRLRLVILSSCSSIGPRAERAAGLAGIARPFLIAGVSQVVGTLWDVKDSASAMLLSGFYREIADGVPVIRALRDVQLAAIGQRRFNKKDGSCAWCSLAVVSNG
jgi:CHAT domain-containing protein